MFAPISLKAVTISQFGGSEVLHHDQRPTPEAGKGQVLIEVAYAGVGTWDPLMREGIFAAMTGETPSFPMILGTDGCGTIAAVGEGVARFREGDAVYAIGAGLYAEYVVIDADAVSKVPKGMPLDQAGALPIAGLTSLQGLADELNISKGDAVLINGASGDVGLVAVQLAKLMGARVLAVASGEDGVSAARELGADSAVDGKTTDIAAAAHDFAPDGLDAVLTFIAGGGLDAAISALREGGRVAYPLGVEPEPDRRPGISNHHFDLTLDTPATIRANMDRLNALIASGPFKVKVAEIFPLDQAKGAQEALAKHRVGKILLSAKR